VLIPLPSVEWADKVRSPEYAKIVDVDDT